jgi:hypothetical protein
VLDAQSACRPWASKESFVFCDVVGDLVLWLETKLNGIVELVPRWRGESGPSPRARKVEGTIKVHDPGTWGLLSRKHRFHLRGLIGEGIGPLGGELH